MPDQFHNPYHFVPTGDEPPETVPLQDFNKPHAEHTHPWVTHNRYVADTHSGRLVCKITVETPTLCGNTHKERNSWTRLIQPFELDGKPAIPASQLRGMLSSVAEAASNSSLRVLEERLFSVRQDLKKGLSAIGMIVEKEGRLELFPLASPHYTLETVDPSHPDANAILSDQAVTTDGDYSTILPYYSQKVYFGESHEIRSNTFLTQFQTPHSIDGGPFYGLRESAAKAAWNSGHGGKIKRIAGNRCHVLLGIQVDQGDVCLWKDIPHNERQDYVRGIVRCLGVSLSRIEGMKNKKHEYFLPFSAKDQKALLNGTAKTFPLTKNAIARFHALADQRAGENGESTPPDELLPYTPNGADRGKPGKGRPASSWQLKSGDVVFFRPSADGKEIEEVSLSSVWRKRVEDAQGARAGMSDFLRDPDLRPLNAERECLTLAEQLFGVVQEGKGDERDSSFALAGRLRISHAVLPESADSKEAWQPVAELLTDGQKEWAQPYGNKDVPLLNLASPKPPSPNFYFKKKEKNGHPGYIRKTDLCPESHEIQGRKFYLRRPADVAVEPSSTHYVGGNHAFVHSQTLGNAMADTDPGRKQHASIAKQHQSAEKFIRPKTAFYFTIDTDNLSDLELQLLLYSLHPNEQFRHLIGHGKPLGFGQLKIETVGWLNVGRSSRYSKEGFGAPRYLKPLVANSAAWPEPMRRWLPENPDSGQSLLDWLTGHLTKFKEWAAGKKLQDVLTALETVGDPAKVTAPVHYPQKAGIDRESAGFQTKHFKWFGENDDETNRRQPGQSLRPLPNSGALPTLNREQTPERPPQQRRQPNNPQGHRHHGQQGQNPAQGGNRQ